MGVNIELKKTKDGNVLEIKLDNEVIERAFVLDDIKDKESFALKLLRDAERTYEAILDIRFLLKMHPGEWQDIAEDASHKLQKIRKAIKELSSTQGT